MPTGVTCNQRCNQRSLDRAIARGHNLHAVGVCGAVGRLHFRASISTINQQM
jgi:hypothetical protein